MRSLVLITLVTWVGADNPSVHLVDDDVGQWTVKDCILVKMKGQVRLFYFLCLSTTSANVASSVVRSL